MLNGVQFYSTADRRRESLAPDAIASAIARRHGLHRNQLYAWRKELRAAADEAVRAGSTPAGFVPVMMTEEAAMAGEARIEIELAAVRSLENGGDFEKH